MSIMDKLKGLLKGRETQVKQGIDKASDVVEKKVGTEHADKVENVAEKAKDAVDQLSGSDADTSATPPVTPPPSTPPASSAP